MHSGDLGTSSVKISSAEDCTDDFTDEISENTIPQTYNKKII